MARPRIDNNMSSIVLQPQLSLPPQQKYLILFPHLPFCESLAIFFTPTKPTFKFQISTSFFFFIYLLPSSWAFSCFIIRPPQTNSRHPLKSLLFFSFISTFFFSPIKISNLIFLFKHENGLNSILIVLFYFNVINTHIVIGFAFLFKLPCMRMKTISKDFY